MLAPCRRAELPSLCTRPEDHRQLFPKPCLIPLLTQPAHGCDNDTRGQGWLSPAVQRPFPLSPRECELPALLGLQEGWLLCPGTQGREAGRACTGTHTQRAGRGGKPKRVSIEISCFSSPPGSRFSCQAQETHLLTKRKGVASF